MVSVAGVEDVQAQQGLGVDDSSNRWAPYGPLVKNLEYKFYASPTQEFESFEQGQLDVTDWELPGGKYASYDANPDFVLSPVQGQFGLFGMYWNLASSTWANWGCDMEFGRSACGVQIRQAFTHLIDRPRWTVDGFLQGAAVPLADPSPPAKDPPGSSLATQCAWDAMHPSCLSAYNIAPDPGGFATLGSPDFCAAANHMIAAGLATGKTEVTCVLTGVVAGVLANPLRYKIRITEPRLSMGNGHMNAVNQLFGAPIVTPQYGGINVIGFPIVFSVPPVSPVDDWDMYTYGYGLGGPYPDHAFGLYRSEGADTLCGGPSSGGFPDNAQFICVPELDTHIFAATFTDDVPLFRNETLAWFNEFGKRVLDIPVFSPGVRMAALKCVGGLVNERGFSYTNPWTMLSAHEEHNCASSNSLYEFGGGDPTTLRWGQANPITQLNWVNVQTAWEFNVVDQIYDTLGVTSPVEVGNVFCWMCNTFTKSIDAEGDTHFLVTLRQNLRFHDGHMLDAYDVKFSFFNRRDYSGNLGLAILWLKSFTVLSPTTLDIGIYGRAISHLLYLESQFSRVLPRHIWELPGDRTYGDVGVADPAKRAVGYDPIAAGTFIGSGPFVCRSIFPEDFGRVGTGCVRNADGTRGGQTIGPGGRLFLQRFDFTSEPGNTDPYRQYMRSYDPSWGAAPGLNAFSGQFQEFTWADRYDNATVTLRDLASVASCFGKSAAEAACPDYSYWLRSVFHPATPDVISTEVAIVACHLDDTWVYPFSWSGDQSSQPGQALQNIVPFTP